MFNLSLRTSDIKLITSAAGDVDYGLSYHKANLLGHYTDEYIGGTITTATTTMILEGSTSPAVPHFNTYVRSFFVKNVGSASNTVTLIIDTAGTIQEVTGDVVLLSNESMLVNDSGIHVYSASGEPKSSKTGSVLAQSAPSATTETDLYTVPAGTSANITSLVVTNRSAATVTFRVSVSVGGGATANKDYLYYDTPIYAYSTIKIDNIGTLSATDKIRIYASTANLSFNLFGA
jgi:hypothetical protein